MLLDPQPMSARQAKDLGVVAEMVPRGRALARAKEIAKNLLAKPEVTRRNTRIHFVQPIKERLGPRGRIRPGARGRFCRRAGQELPDEGNE